MWNKKISKSNVNSKQNKLYQDEKANFKDIKRSSQKTEILKNYIMTSQEQSEPKFQKDFKNWHEKAKK